MKTLRMHGWMFLLLATLAGADEASPPLRRKSTFRVYDQRPIHVPGAWESPRVERRNEPEYLPSASTGGFRTQTRSFGDNMFPMQNIAPTLQTTVAPLHEEKEKESSWLKPLDFLSDDDLIGKKELEEFSLEPAGDDKDSPTDWSNLQETLIEKELQTPEEKQEEAKTENPQSQAALSPSLPATTGLTLAPVVSEISSPATRTPLTGDTRVEATTISPASGNVSGASPLPSALRMDSVQAMSLPSSAADRAFERSRAEFQAVQTQWQRPDAASPFSDGISSRPSFSPASSPSTLGISPLPDSRANAPTAIAMPVPFSPPLQPVAFSQPAVSAPPPSPVIDRDRFRTEDYRIRPRTGSAFP
jgi:hypothetical protein